MVIITNYRLDEQGGFFYVKTSETSTCPVCVAFLTVRGLRQRVLIFEDGDIDKKEKLMIRRLFCSECNRIHHELPDCIVPYKRHCANTIIKLIERNPGKVSQNTADDYTPCGRDTVRRILSWWYAVAPYLAETYKTLMEKLNKPYDTKPSFKALVRAACNSSNWIFAKSISTRSATMSG